MGGLSWRRARASLKGLSDSAEGHSAAKVMGIGQVYNCHDTPSTCAEAW